MEEQLRERPCSAHHPFGPAFPPVCASCPSKDLESGAVSIDVRHSLARDIPWVAGVAVVAVSLPEFGSDSSVYWRGLRGGGYTQLTYRDFHYSPLFAQVVGPVARSLALPTFEVVASLLALLGVLWLLWPLGPTRTIPWTLVCSQEIISGNIDWAVACVIVLGARAAPLWIIPLATKVTNTMGLLWHVARGDWRWCGWFLAGFVGLFGLSWWAAPDQWAAYLAFLWDNARATGIIPGQVLYLPLQARLPIAGALTVWGARTDRRWVLPVAVWLASPVAGLGPATVLAALPRFAGTGVRSVHG